MTSDELVTSLCHIYDSDYLVPDAQAAHFACDQVDSLFSGVLQTPITIPDTVTKNDDEKLALNARLHDLMLKFMPVQIASFIIENKSHFCQFVNKPVENEIFRLYFEKGTDTSTIPIPIYSYEDIQARLREPVPGLPGRPCFCREECVFATSNYYQNTDEDVELDVRHFECIEYLRDEEIEEFETHGYRNSTPGMCIGCITAQALFISMVILKTNKNLNTICVNPFAVQANQVGQLRHDFVLPMSGCVLPGICGHIPCFQTSLLTVRYLDNNNNCDDSVPKPRFLDMSEIQVNDESQLLRSVTKEDAIRFTYFPIQVSTQPKDDEQLFLSAQSSLINDCLTILNECIIDTYFSPQIPCPLRGISVVENMDDWAVSEVGVHPHDIIVGFLDPSVRAWFDIRDVTTITNPKTWSQGLGDLVCSTFSVSSFNDLLRLPVLQDAFPSGLCEIFAQLEKHYIVLYTVARWCLLVRAGQEFVRWIDGGPPSQLFSLHEDTSCEELESFRPIFFRNLSSLMLTHAPWIHYLVQLSNMKLIMSFDDKQLQHVYAILRPEAQFVLSWQTIPDTFVSLLRAFLSSNSGVQSGVAIGSVLHETVNDPITQIYSKTLPIRNAMKMLKRKFCQVVSGVRYVLEWSRLVFLLHTFGLSRHAEMSWLEFVVREHGQTLSTMLFHMVNDYVSVMSNANKDFPTVAQKKMFEIPKVDENVSNASGFQFVSNVLCGSDSQMDTTEVGAMLAAIQEIMIDAIFDRPIVMHMLGASEVAYHNVSEHIKPVYDEIAKMFPTAPIARSLNENHYAGRRGSGSGRGRGRGRRRTSYVEYEPCDDDDNEDDDGDGDGDNDDDGDGDLYEPDAEEDCKRTQTQNYKDVHAKLTLILKTINRRRQETYKRLIVPLSTPMAFVSNYVRTYTFAHQKTIDRPFLTPMCYRPFETIVFNTLKDLLTKSVQREWQLIKDEIHQCKPDSVNREIHVKNIWTIFQRITSMTHPVMNTEWERLKDLSQACNDDMWGFTPDKLYDFFRNKDDFYIVYFLYLETVRAKVSEGNDSMKRRLCSLSTEGFRDAIIAFGSLEYFDTVKTRFLPHHIAKKQLHALCTLVEMLRAPCIPDTAFHLGICPRCGDVKNRVSTPDTPIVDGFGWERSKINPHTTYDMMDAWLMHKQLSARSMLSSHCCRVSSTQKQRLASGGKAKRNGERVERKKPLGTNILHVETCGINMRLMNGVDDVDMSGTESAARKNPYIKSIFFSECEQVHCFRFNLLGRIITTNTKSKKSYTLCTKCAAVTEYIDGINNSGDDIFCFHCLHEGRVSEVFGPDDYPVLPVQKHFTPYQRLCVYQCVTDCPPCYP